MWCVGRDPVAQPTSNLRTKAFSLSIERAVGCCVEEGEIIRAASLHCRPTQEQQNPMKERTKEEKKPHTESKLNVGSVVHDSFV